MSPVAAAAVGADVGHLADITKKVVSVVSGCRRSTTTTLLTGSSEFLAVCVALLARTRVFVSLLSGSKQRCSGKK